jgi:hypothetical protein
VSTDPGADGFNTASDGSLRGSATSAATDYSSWDWKEIEAAIYGSSMNTSASDTAYDSGVSDPQTFYDTANALEYTRQLLNMVATSLSDQANALAKGTDAPWQGAAADQFVTTMTSFSKQVQATADNLTGGLGGSVPQQLMDTGNQLATSRNNVISIDNWYAQQAINQGIGAMTSGTGKGLIPVSQDPQLVTMMNNDMYNYAMKPLVAKYQTTERNLYNPTSAAPNTGSGSGNGPTDSPPADPPPSYVPDGSITAAPGLANGLVSDPFTPTGAQDSSDPGLSDAPLDKAALTSFPGGSAGPDSGPSDAPLGNAALTSFPGGSAGPANGLSDSPLGDSALSSFPGGANAADNGLSSFPGATNGANQPGDGTGDGGLAGVSGLSGFPGGTSNSPSEKLADTSPGTGLGNLQPFPGADSTGDPGAIGAGAAGGSAAPLAGLDGLQSGTGANGLGADHLASAVPGTTSGLESFPGDTSGAANSGLESGMPFMPGMGGAGGSGLTNTPERSDASGLLSDDATPWTPNAATAADTPLAGVGAGGADLSGLTGDGLTSDGLPAAGLSADGLPAATSGLAADASPADAEGMPMIPGMGGGAGGNGLTNTPERSDASGLLSDDATPWTPDATTAADTPLAGATAGGAGLTGLTGDGLTSDGLPADGLSADGLPADQSLASSATPAGAEGMPYMPGMGGGAGGSSLNSTPERSDASGLLTSDATPWTPDGTAGETPLAGSAAGGAGLTSDGLPANTNGVMLDSNGMPVGAAEETAGAAAEDLPMLPGMGGGGGADAGSQPERSDASGLLTGTAAPWTPAEDATSMPVAGDAGGGVGLTSDVQPTSPGGVPASSEGLPNDGSGAPATGGGRPAAGNAVLLDGSSLPAAAAAETADPMEGLPMLPGMGAGAGAGAGSQPERSDASGLLGNSTQPWADGAVSEEATAGAAAQSGAGPAAGATSSALAPGHPGVLLPPVLLPETAPTDGQRASAPEQAASEQDAATATGEHGAAAQNAVSAPDSEEATPATTAAATASVAATGSDGATAGLVAEAAAVPMAAMDGFITAGDGEAERSHKAVEPPPDRAVVLSQPDGPDDTSAWDSTGTAAALFLLPAVGRGRDDDRAADPATRYSTEEDAWVEPAPGAEADPGFTTWRRSSTGAALSASAAGLAGGGELRCSTAETVEEAPAPAPAAAEADGEDEDGAGHGVADLLKEKADLWGSWPSDLGVL